MIPRLVLSILLIGWCSSSLVRGGLFVFTTNGLPYDLANPQPLSSYACSNTTAGCKGAASWASFKYQIDRINANATLLPNTKLVIDATDDQGSQSQSFFRAYDLMNRGNRIVAGPALSSLALNAALVAQGFKVPLISYSASSPILANKQQYPYFMRVCHDDAQQGEAIAWFAKYQFNWQRMAILYTSDGYGQGGATKFIEAAFAYNITVITEQSFAVGSTIDDVTLPLQRIQSTGARIILYFGQSAEFSLVVKKANEMGMFNNETAWVVSDTVWSSDQSAAAVAQRLVTHGLLVLTPDSGLGTPLFNEFAADFVGRNVSNLPKLEQYSPPTAASISPYNIYAADTANVLAHALHDLYEVQGLSNFTQDQLFTALKNVDVPGISGRLAFDSNLDRVGLRYILNNCQNGQWKRMGVYTEQTYTPIAGAGPILWADGTANIPLSQPLPPPPPLPPTSILTADASNALLAVGSICLIIIVGNLVGLWFARTSRVFHAASPTMLSLVLIGGALVCSSVIISGLDQTVARCTIRQWFFNIGFQASFGAMLLKTYRVHKIFNNGKLQVLSLNDSFLFKLLAVCIVFDSIVLALRSGISPYYIDVNNVCSFESGQQQSAATALTLILVVSKGLMILFAAYLSYAVRNLPQLYNESTYLGIAIYNTLLIGAAWIGVRYGIDMSDHPQAVTEFESALMLASTAITLTLIFAPKWVDVYQAEKQKAYFNDVRRRATKKSGRSKSGKSADDHGRANALAGISHGTGGVNASVISAHDSDSSVSGQPSIKLGNMKKTTDDTDGPRSQLEVETLLNAALADQTKRLEIAFKYIETLQHNIGEKKKEVASVTDVIFQIQCELDFFREVGAGLTPDEVSALFKGRLQEFNAVPQANHTMLQGSVLDDGNESSSHLGATSGGAKSTVPPSSLSAAYAAVRTSMDKQNASTQPGQPAPLPQGRASAMDGGSKGVLRSATVTGTSRPGGALGITVPHHSNTRASMTATPTPTQPNNSIADSYIAAHLNHGSVTEPITSAPGEGDASSCISPSANITSHHDIRLEGGVEGSPILSPHSLAPSPSPPPVATPSSNPSSVGSSPQSSGPRHIRVHLGDGAAPNQSQSR